MRSDTDRLRDIVRAVENVEKYTSRGKANFDAEELVQTWCVHQIQIIGEAASRLSHAMTSATTDIPWGPIVGMRNLLVHGYFGVDLDEVWLTAVIDLPALKNRVIELLQSDGNSSSDPS